MLSTLGRAEQCDAAAALFQDMTRNGPSPDKVTNQTMVSVFERVYRYEEAAVFRSILNMAPAIVRTGKGQAHVQGQGQGQGQVSPSSSTKIEEQIASSSKMYGEANDDKRSPNQISILSGNDDIIPDSTAVTFNIDDQNDVLTYVQNDPTPLEDYYPDIIRLSPAGTLKDKLLADGRRVGKKKKEFSPKGLEEIGSTARTDSEVSTNDESEKVKKARSKKNSADTKKSSDEEVVGEGIEVEKIKSKLKTKDKEKVQKAEKGGKEEKSIVNESSKSDGTDGVGGSEVKWEKGGGGAAAMIRLLGIAGKTTEALELFLSLEKEGEKGNVPLPTSLYNAASKFLCACMCMCVCMCVLLCVGGGMCVCVCVCFFFNCDCCPIFQQISSQHLIITQRRFYLPFTTPLIFLIRHISYISYFPYFYYFSYCNILTLQYLRVRLMDPGKLLLLSITVCCYRVIRYKVQVKRQEEERVQGQWQGQRVTVWEKRE